MASSPTIPFFADLMRGLPEVLLFRHGETEWNRAGRFQGALDSALTEKGRAQAAALGTLLGGLGVAAYSHDIRSSPQGRARETARIAFEPLGWTAVEDPRLAEIGMGAWTGLSRREVAAGWPGPEGEGVLAFYARCPGGEPLPMVTRRASEVLAELRRPTVLVTHGITLRILCSLALGQPLEAAEQVAVPQGSLARIVRGRLEVITPEPPGLPQEGPGSSPDPGGG